MKNLVLIGTNCNEISSEKESLFNIIKSKQPGAFFLQETKIHRKGPIKVPDYEIFEVFRQNRNGGCILTGVHKSLEPLMISDDEDLEILTVQIGMGKNTCRFINAYGPKEGTSQDDHTI